MWRFWTARIDGERGSKDAEWAIYTYIACSCVLYWRWDWEIKVRVFVTSLHYDRPAAGTDTSRSVSVPKHWRWRFNWLASKQRIDRGSQPIEEDNLLIWLWPLGICLGMAIPARPPHNKGTRLNVTEFMPSETRAINAKFNDADAEWCASGILV